MDITITVKLSGINDFDNIVDTWNDIKDVADVKQREICLILNEMSKNFQNQTGEKGPQTIIVAQPTIGNGHDRYVWKCGQATLVALNGLKPIESKTWDVPISKAKNLLVQLLTFQPSLAFVDACSKD